MLKLKLRAACGRRLGDFDDAAAYVVEGGLALLQVD